MDKKLKSILKSQIKTYLQKKSHASDGKIIKWLYIGAVPGPDTLNAIKKESLRSFVVYQKKKFAMHGFCADHLKGNGRPSVPGRKIAQVKRLMNNKERRSTRSVSNRVGVSQTSVVRIMKKYGYKAYHKYKVQKMSDEHKERRVECARMFLSVYGRRVRNDRKWGKIINTDFSAKITTFATRNSKNDVIWSLSRESAGDMLDAPEEKFTKGHMIWGGVSYRGLVPRTAPIFAGDLYNEYEPKPKTINSIMYADMIKEKAGPAVLEVYPDGSGVFQDDGATIHRAEVSLRAVEETFTSRVDHTTQAPKMADVWPIENVWSILKGKVAEKECSNDQQLKKAIIAAWREIDDDKALCRHLMASLPHRLQAVIDKEGRQIHKEDY